MQWFVQWLGILLMAALLATVPASGNAQPAGEKGASPAAQPKAQESGAPAAAGTSYVLKDRQAYQKKVTADLDQLQQKINGLLTGANPQMRRSIARERLALQKKVIAARQQLAALEKSSEKDWDRLRGELDKAVEEIKKDYEKIEASLQ